MSAVGFVGRLRGRALREALGACLLVLLGCLPGAARAVLPIEHWTTAGGARVLFVRAPAIPMLDVNIDFDAGGRFDPPDRVGLAGLTNAMLAKATAGLDEAAIAEAFAMQGAQRGGGAGDDRASVSLRTLTSEPELSASLALLAKLMAAPGFPGDVLAREQERLVQAVRESDTKPETIARRAFGAALYGTHPYGVDPTEASYRAIQREDLVAFHRARYGARGAVVSMIGAITRAQAERIAEQLTAGLPAGEPAPPPPAIVAPERAVERRIAHPASQSHILIGLPAIARNDPDFFPLLVGNYVLGGGGFVSRLYAEVREKRGLTYSVYSYFSPQLQPGPFTIGLQTQKAQTDTALKVVRDTLETFLAQGPTEAELAAARANLIGGFPLRIDSNRKILDNLANIGFYGLPYDYLDTWTERVGKVTVAQVRAAFARHVRPERLATIVVGDGGSGASGDASAAPGREAAASR
jgi:zinc protease